MDKLVQIVDEHDQPIGALAMEEAWLKGQWHRIVRIMVQAEDGSFLLQKRSKNMKTYPERWDNSASGHVDEGEDYLTAAKRELQEEIGIDDVRLQEINHYQTNNPYKNYQLRRFHRVYLAQVPKTIKTKRQVEEVSELKWFTKAELQTMLDKQPELMSDGLIQVLTRCNLL